MRYHLPQSPDRQLDIDSAITPVEPIEPGLEG